MPRPISIPGVGHSTTSSPRTPEPDIGSRALLESNDSDLGPGLLPTNAERSDGGQTNGPLPTNRPLLKRASTIFHKLTPELKLPHSKSVPLVPTASNAPREIPLRRGGEWRWLNVVAFWTGACFAIGSLLFTVGAGVSTYRPHLDPLGFSEWKRRALVDYAYAIGGSYFEVGSYLSFYEVINVGRTQHRYFAGPAGAMSASGYWGSLFYFIGASFFQVAVFVALFTPGLTTRKQLVLEWIPQALGGALFTLAACVESWHNRSASPRSYVYWVCMFYLVGSALFFFAAASGTYFTAVGEADEELHVAYVDRPYLIGSIAFAIGAWAQLLMWKNEQFGLGFITEINEDFAEARRAAAKEEYAPTEEHASTEEHTPTAGVLNVVRDRWSHAIDLFFLAMYLFNGALSTLNFSLSYVWYVYNSFEQYSDLEWNVEGLLEADELISDITAYIAAHSMLLLATAVHFMPTLQPFGYLLWLLRGISLLFLCAGALRCAKYIQEVVPSSPHCTTLSSETLPEAVFPVQLVLSNLTST
jgi:hypothetical protein